LRTAVIVAQALANQKLCSTRSPADTTTAKPDRVDVTALATRASPSRSSRPRATIGIQSLQRSFDNVYQAMDSFETFQRWPPWTR